MKREAHTTVRAWAVPRPEALCNDGGMMKLPDHGVPWEELQQRMDALRQDDVDWRDGRLGVYVFHPGDDVLEVGKQAYAAFHTENGLGKQTAFPSLETMYSEVLEIGAQHFQAPDGWAGDMTSGGTESIFLAVQSCRDWTRAQGRTQADELLLPHSAHPAFDKAAGYLGLRVMRVPVGDDLRADVDRMASAITERTVMLVGSAPCYPYGLVDPIEELGQLAQSRGLWLHVDACVGGYVLPFVRAIGEEVPAFDFSVPGVRSISADLHKYGFAPKAASTLFHRSREQHAFQTFDFSDWPCGQMTTTTSVGTRPGGAIAGAWAVLQYLGRSGYEERARQIRSAHRGFAEAGAALGMEPLTSDLPILVLQTGRGLGRVWRGLKERGWFTGVVTGPAGIHLMVQPKHAEKIEEFGAALRDAARDVTPREQAPEARYS